MTKKPNPKKSYDEIRQEVYDNLRNRFRKIGIEDAQAHTLADLTIRREESLLRLRDRLAEYFLLRYCSALEVNPW